MIWYEAASIDSSVAGLPGRVSERVPVSTTRPSSIRAATRSGDGDSGQPVRRAISARLISPSAYSIWSTSERLWRRACSGSTFACGRSVRRGSYCLVPVDTFVSTAYKQT